MLHPLLREIYNQKTQLSQKESTTEASFLIAPNYPDQYRNTRIPNTMGLAQNKVEEFGTPT
jgi:hypothetical protein